MTRSCSVSPVSKGRENSTLNTPFTEFITKDKQKIHSLTLKMNANHKKNKKKIIITFTDIVWEDIVLSVKFGCIV